MRKISNIGRIFFAIAIAAMGFQTIYTGRLPYILIPPTHFSPPVLATLAYITGTAFVLVGGCIAFTKKMRLAALLLGSLLLLIFCFYYIPYQFIANPNFMHFDEWENAAKELALAGGAFVIARMDYVGTENPPTGFFTRLLPCGAILFAITTISFGIDHLLSINDTADYIPSWIPAHIFWAYFTGIALLGSGIAIISKIKIRLIATLLGIMIFTWFIILHIPRVVVAPSAPELRGEITSAFLALAYSGITFVIAGTAKK